MKLIDEQLRELYRQQTARSARGTADCLPEELLHRTVAAELSADEQRRVIRHLRNCSDCAREYRVVRASKQWTSGIAAVFGGQSATPRTRPAPLGGERPLAVLWNRIMFKPGWRVGALAAMVVIVAGISLMVWRSTLPVGSPEPLERGVAGLAMKVDPPDGAHLSEAPRKLIWNEVKGAEGYHVALYDFELTLIWESSQVNTTSIEIPDSVRTSLPRGRVYWRVFVATGIERRQSDLFQFLLVANDRK
jgi:hypothetical protein